MSVALNAASLSPGIGIFTKESENCNHQSHVHDIPVNLCKGTAANVFLLFAGTVHGGTREASVKAMVLQLMFS